MSRKWGEIASDLTKNENRKESLDDLKGQEKKAQTGLKESSDTITKTQGEMEKLQWQIDNKKGSIEKLENEQWKLKESVNKIGQDIEWQKKLLEDPAITPEARSAIENNISALTQALKIANARLKAIPGEIAPLKKEKEEFEWQYKALAATLPGLKTKRDGFQTTINTLEPKIKPLEEKFMAKQREISEQLEKSHQLADTREDRLDRREDAEKSMLPYEKDYTWPG